MVPAGAVGHHVDIPRALGIDRQRNVDRVLIALADGEVAGVGEALDDRLVVQSLVAAGPVGFGKPW